MHCRGNFLAIAEKYIFKQNLNNFPKEIKKSNQLPISNEISDGIPEESPKQIFDKTVMNFFEEIIARIPCKIDV